MSEGVLLLISTGYVGLLFLLAYWGDGRGFSSLTPRRRAVLYSLTLAVYCTSWTFYGAVGAAVNGGWAFLPIYLGPLLLLVFGRGLLERLVLASKTQNITSIADFVASRYGKAQHLAVLVTLVAVVGVLPYLALQLKAVALSVEVLARTPAHGRPLFTDTAFIVAVLLALLAILFGTRRIDATEHHRGLMLAIALESLVKLLALGAVAAYALYRLSDGGLPDLGALAADPRLKKLMAPDALPPGFLAQTLLAFAALFCLPRQFHVAVVECEDARFVKTARWLFSGYLILVSLAVLPIAAVTLTDPRLAGSYPDMAILLLPLAGGHDILALLVFIGGFSAATGMVIVATVALSTMICNDLVMPVLWRLKLFGLPERKRLLGLLLAVRRISILAVALLGYVYYRLTEQYQQLATIGLLAFSAVVQFAPALVAGLYWRGGSRRGATAGLAAGFGLWLYTLLLPNLARAGWLSAQWVHDGPFGLAWLRPQALFNLSGWDPLTHGVFWSLLANIGLFVFMSLRYRPDLNERIQATPFLDPYASPATAAETEDWGRITIGELMQLAGRIVGEEYARDAFWDFSKNRGQTLMRHQFADRGHLQFTERLLAGAMGAPSARAMLTTALRGSGMDIGQVMSLLDQTSEVQRFNRELLHTMMENIAQGICVVDADMRIVAWNRRYLELFDYPDGMIYVGCPVANLIRFNAERGECGPGDVEEHVSKRIAHMRAGTPHVFERVRADGRVIEMRGQPLQGGGYVTTYADVTHFKQTEQALRESERNIRVYTDSVPVMLAYVDADMRFRFANRAYLNFFNMTREELVGRPIREVLNEAQLRRREEHIAAVLKGERQDFEIELDTHRGTSLYALGTYIPEFDRDGRVAGFYSIFQDISARRRAELALAEAKAALEVRVEQRTQELREALSAQEVAKQDAVDANLSKTRFIAAASHDLLQPLNAARLFTAALGQHDTDDSEVKTLARQIDGSLRGAEELLSVLLDISRLDTGALTPNLGAIPLRELFNALRVQFAPLAATRGLKFRCIDTSLAVVSDRQMLRRIVQNFVSNALRYTRGGGVVLGARREGKQVRIEVWDTGPGIPPSQQRMIFEEFQRLGEVSPWGEKGLGLGLAICERMARRLEHRIGLRSEPGMGSVFTLILPRATDTDVREIEPAPTIPAGSLAGMKVLCIDNEPAILEGMRALLSRWGCAPLVAADQDAAEAALAEQPDVVLADFHLEHGVDGLALLSLLTHRNDKPLPGALITADHSEALAAKVKAAGFSLLRKPVKPAALRAFLAAQR